LHTTAWNAAATEVIPVLLAAGANPDERDQDGSTPLAALVGSRNATFDAVRTLLDAGANINSATTEGFTVLMSAARNATDPALIDLLLDLGADATATDDQDRTAFDHARENDALYGTDAYWRLNDARFQ
jgi:ankyrin repeat protein